MNELGIAVMGSTIGSVVVSLLIVVICKPISSFLLRVFRKDDSIIEYYFNRKKIIKFSSKNITRISVGVLANIENKSGDVLLILKGNQNNRQDNQWKPIGGVIKISDKIDKVLKKEASYNYDNKSKYSAQKKDFRIEMEINSNKIINKALYVETNNYYISELKREVMEELNLNLESFKEIFEINKNPNFIHSWFRSKVNSPLGTRDYLHEIVYSLEIKNQENLDKLISKTPNLQWINLSGSTKEIAITSFWLKEKNNFKNFK